MLFFTRWKAAGILLFALVVCLFAVPNFFAEKTVARWPSWAQRHIVLGLDLQGGSSLLLEVDTSAVRKERLQTLNDDVLRVLRQARIPFTGRAIHGNGVEVRITRDTDVKTALDKLGELSQPLSGILGSSGQRSLDITQNAGLITLTPSDAALTDRIRQAVDQSIEIIQRRVNELGLVEPSIQREGLDRILVQVPGLQDPTHLKDILGKTAKLDFRMVDQ
jgi:preprotein translocase subunit SecD